MAGSRRRLVALLLAGLSLACGGQGPVPTPSPGPVPQQPVAEPTANCARPVMTGDPNTSSPPRCIIWAGMEWVVKSSPHFDPGPNQWSDGTDNVFVDAAGLHLRITNAGGTWRSSEVVANQPFGYGRYVFRTATDVAELDSTTVLGFFTYDYRDPAFAHREIDIEFSPMLGFTAGARGHFTVQPWQTRSNTFDFRVTPGDTDSLHVFDWRPGRVEFSSGAVRWTTQGPDVPIPGNATNVRINFWSFSGRPPAGDGALEIVVSSFQYSS
jgi:hypothetical protein